MRSEVLRKYLLSARQTPATKGDFYFVFLAIVIKRGVLKGSPLFIYDPLLTTDYFDSTAPDISPNTYLCPFSKFQPVSLG